MTPFQEFRLWARRAPNGQRASAAAAGLVVLALLIWAAIPIANSGPGGSSGAVVSTGPIVVSATPPSPAPKPAKCTNPTGAVNGVTPTQIKVGVIIVQATGIATNADLGILPATVQKTGWEGVINNVNSAGGVDCRQIVPDYINANPADQASLQQICLSLVQDKVFAVLDGGAFAAFPIVGCFGQHHLPYFGGYLLPNSQMAKFYPYLFELNSQDSVYHDMVVGLQQQGFFKPANGFTKLGYLYNDCHPELHSEVVKWLGQAGITPAQTVGVDSGCTTAFTPASTLQQAILKFKQAHVSNVIITGMVGDVATFTELAAVQKFTPKYGFGDDSLITISYGLTKPDPRNIDGAIAITASRNGEERTPGVTQTAATVKCGQIVHQDLFKAANAAGNACDQMWMFTAAVEHAPTLSQSSLADGLKAARSVPFAYPEGPNDFAAGSHITYGGQYWRTTQFHATCTCWQLVNQTFHPSPL
jgi:hypothetical protein